jgi:DNA-binding winged helix-turn-helix (wHTH) protein
MAWPPFSGGPRSVDTQVLTLRRKLEQAGLGEGGGIETMRQQGYRFSLETLPSEADSNGNGHGTGAPITSLAMPLP